MHEQAKTNTEQAPACAQAACGPSLTSNPDVQRRVLSRWLAGHVEHHLADPLYEVETLRSNLNQQRNRTQALTATITQQANTINSLRMNASAFMAQLEGAWDQLDATRDAVEPATPEPMREDTRHALRWLATNT